METRRHLFFLPSIPIDESGESTRIVRTALLVMLVTIGALFSWSALAPLSGAVIAGGIVKFDTHRKTVQHLHGGIVKEILVREGSRVEEGEPLITLEDSLSSSDLNILRDQLNALLAKEARLEAEKNLAESVEFPSSLTDSDDPKVDKLLANEVAVFKARRDSLNEQIELLTEKIQEAYKAEKGSAAQISAIKESIAYISQRLAAAEKLHVKHFISDVDILTIKESLSQKREVLGAATAALAQLRETIADLKLDISRLRHKYREDADIEYQETKKQIFEVEERLRPAEETQKRQVILSPTGGQVLDLKVNTPGGVIKAGEPLMDVVPDQGSLVLEVKIAPYDIDNVHVDQPADIQLDAFNRRTTPLLTGSVIYVSGDSLEDPVRGERYYLAHVAVPSESMADVEAVALSPGMPVTAYLKTKERTFSEYLMSPMLDRMRRAFRDD